MNDATDEVRAIHWLLAGRVQGVGFRWFVLRLAQQQDVVGDVRNSVDGRVEIRAVGISRKLEAFLDDVRRGPRGSHVDRVEELEPGSDWSFSEFEIRLD